MMLKMFSSVWRYRYFIFVSIKREFKAKFARSRLGGFWMLLNPLAQVLMFTFVLSAVLSAKLPGINNKYSYAAYLMAGTLGWSLFSEIVNRCLTLFPDNSNILKKLAFPKITLPLIVVGSSLVNNALLFIAILLIFSLLGFFPGVSFFWLPILVILNITLALGLGLILGVLNVFMRDIGQIIPVMMQFLFWFTPIVYMVHIIPVQYQHWLKLNPLFPIITGYQSVLLYNQTPDLSSLALILLIALLLLAFSFVLFRKANSEMVDQL